MIMAQIILKERKIAELREKVGLAIGKIKRGKTEDALTQLEQIDFELKTAGDTKEPQTQNQFKSKTDDNLPPDGCGIIIEFYDTPNTEPGPDSGNATDVMNARIKTVSFVRDRGELDQPQIVEIRFNEKGEILINEKSVGVFDIRLTDYLGNIYYLVSSAQIV